MPRKPPTLFPQEQALLSQLGERRKLQDLALTSVPTRPATPKAPRSPKKPSPPPPSDPSGPLP